MAEPSPVDDYELGCAIVHWSAARHGEEEIARQAIADAPATVEQIGARFGPAIREFAELAEMLQTVWARCAPNEHVDLGEGEKDG